MMGVPGEYPVVRQRVLENVGVRNLHSGKALDEEHREDVLASSIVTISHACPVMQ